jgi:hypothetical protein
VGLWLVLLARAVGAGPPAQWDARIPQGIQPSWFGPVVCQPALNLHLWRAPIRTPEGSGDLAVTLVFRQVPGGLARVIWQGPGRVVTLCANLFEPAAPLHQRTLLIPRETLGAEGQIFVESTGPGPCLERVVLEWMEPRILGSVGSAARMVSEGGRVWAGGELGGVGLVAAGDEVHAGFVDALLEAGPVSLEGGQGVRLLAFLQGRPGLGRIRAQVSGLGPGEEVPIWVNGSPLGSVAVEMPRLDDPGYRRVGGEEWAYGGWRTLTAFVPAGWLRGGENEVDLTAPAGRAGLVLRNVRLEVAAEAAGVSPGRAVAAPAAEAPRAVAPAARGPVKPVVVPRLRTGLSSGHTDVGLRPE